MQSKKILSFLKDLAANNDREWMQVHKVEYQEAKLAFEEIVEQLILGIQSFDSTIIGLKPKECIFRLHRDTRFSPDKTPYKLNFGVSISKGGKKAEDAGYYMHIQPNGESFVGGGRYMPSGEHLKKIRQEIDYNTDEYKGIIYDTQFTSAFGEVWGDKLVRAPKGYAIDHPEIELLRYKSYIAMHKLSDKEVQSENLIELAVDLFRKMKPFNDFLNRSTED
ncbi:DUF2461 domain-containing protein [Limibacter armeniacum]|uniref:DUF2461 domain-containing protein n=1 Tax=Limibacter armeniacum TaxID=466084 RepID=UPI002FE69896